MKPQSITAAQYRELYCNKSKAKAKPKGKGPNKTALGNNVGNMKLSLIANGIPFQSEYRFHPVRRFLFDIALPEHKIAIEYEGLNSDKSRHTTKKGYTGDCEKYNLAQSMGWRVLRYTALNYRNMITDLRNLLNQTPPPRA